MVADASALVEYLLRLPGATSIRMVLTNEETDLHVPALCDVEVAAVFRRAMLAGVMPERRMWEAVEDYLDLPITRHGHQGLLPRIMELRENFTAYDGTYLALAEALPGSLLTADDRLMRGARAHTEIPVLPYLR
ncbi:MAG: type II toxin-antitoxin system VapC family toxin [Actinomycetota bacterium]